MGRVVLVLIFWLGRNFRYLKLRGFLVVLGGKEDVEDRVGSRGGRWMEAIVGVERVGT